MANSFSFPATRYFSRQYREPFGCTSRKRPPPSDSLYGLGPGFACRILVSVSRSRAMRETRPGALYPRANPVYPVDYPQRGWMATVRIVLSWTATLAKLL